MAKLESAERLRQEADILDRIEQVKRLIQMETTLLTCGGVVHFCGYHRVDRKGIMVGDSVHDLLMELRDEIQDELLTITALCYGDSPDTADPGAMLRFRGGAESDRFRDTWDACLSWEA